MSYRQWAATTWQTSTWPCRGQWRFLSFRIKQPLIFAWCGENRLFVCRCPPLCCLSGRTKGAVQLTQTGPGWNVLSWIFLLFKSLAESWGAGCELEAPHCACELRSPSWIPLSGQEIEILCCIDMLMVIYHRGLREGRGEERASVDQRWTAGAWVQR